uniref:PHD-type domain-containing protein n=1 Tax=Caenorhabditis japonica TaxID=281687 RepID=A0A8R1HIF7_CAEJA
MQRKEKEDKGARKKLKYDPAEGLLPEIRKALGFPKHVDEVSPRGAGKKKKVIEEEWSMPEAQNCGFCSIGGDILCCETCPASFHLSCLGIDEDDVPEGNFYCNRCQNTPKNVQLFPPEKCSSSTSPLIRIENENRRNWETIEWQYNKMRDESGANTALPPPGFPPEEELFDKSWPDPLLLEVLAMANPMEFSLPPHYLAEREFQPNDSLDERRPTLCKETCTECELRDDWSPQLQCDFCSRIWHQKCVNPPLINIPRHNYWMCPNHTESLLESIWQGAQIRRNERQKVLKKYRKLNRMLYGSEIFRRFLGKMKNQMILNTYFYIMSNREHVVFEPTQHENPVTSSITQRISTRKSGRGRKKENYRLFGNYFALRGINEIPVETETNTVAVAKKCAESERKDRDLDRLDRKRSIKFSEEELIMSVMSYDDRKGSLHRKMDGFDVEMAAGFLTRHQAMIERCKMFYANLPEIGQSERVFAQDFCRFLPFRE